MGVRVAVIDSGIHAAHPHIGGIAGGFGFGGDFIDRIGHGTAVAAAIREKAPLAELFAVKIFDRALAADIDKLVEAIRWSGTNGMQLINLSLGTTNVAHEPALREAVTEATRAGAIVISAYEQDGAPSLPGSLPGVVGVLLDWDCPRDEYRIAKLRVRASGYPRPIPGVAPERNLKGISFAVANVTGFAARLMEQVDVRDAEALLTALLEKKPEATGAPGIK
jgi:subtilisin family serine protease